MLKRYWGLHIYEGLVPRLILKTVFDYLVIVKSTKGFLLLVFLSDILVHSFLVIDQYDS